MADDTPPKSPELEAAELRKTIAEARKAELEAEREAMSLEQDRVYWERKRRQHAEEDAYDNDRHRVVYLNTSVSGGSVEKVRNKLQTWRREEPGCDIEIILNSPGGSVFDGLDLGDLIEEMVDDGHQITTRIAGIAASMAGVLAQFGSRRIMGRNSYLHLHEVATGAIGKAADLEDTAELAKRLTVQICDIYARRSPKSSAQIHKMMKRHEVYLTPDQALELGFIDEIA